MTAATTSAGRCRIEGHRVGGMRGRGAGVALKRSHRLVPGGRRARRGTARRHERVAVEIALAYRAVGSARCRACRRDGQARRCDAAAGAGGNLVRAAIAQRLVLGHPARRAPPHGAARSTGARHRAARPVRASSFRGACHRARALDARGAFRKSLLRCSSCARMTSSHARGDAASLHECALLDAAQHDDRRAQEELLRRYEPLIRATVRRLWMPCRCDCGDIAQEARIGLLAAIRGWQPTRGPFRAFAATCARRQALKALDTARARKHQLLNRALSMHATVPLPTPPDTGETVSGSPSTSSSKRPAASPIPWPRYSRSRSPPSLLSTRVTARLGSGHTRCGGARAAMHPMPAAGTRALARRSARGRLRRPPAGTTIASAAEMNGWPPTTRVPPR